MYNILDQKNSRKQGDVGLGYAIAYFTKIGATVCLPLTDNQKYDLVFEEDNELKKVSIKTTKQLNKTKKKNVVSLRTCGGNRSRQNIDMFDNTSVDYLFILTSKNQKYLIPSNEIDCKNSIVLGDEYDKYIVDL